VVGVWGVDVFGVAVWCVFPAGEYEDGCAGCVRGCEVCGGDCVFHGVGGICMRAVYLATGPTFPSSFASFLSGTTHE
jgi:hypothetical protein